MMQLFDATGERKYLTPDQRQTFLRAAEKAPADVYTFCWTLGLTGCRLSEGLALIATRVDKAASLLIFESLKKRRKGVFRAVPVPSAFLKTLDAVHDLSALGGDRLWKWSRTTAWRRVKEVMERADIQGLYATPKGLRHGFGIKATTSEVPLNMTQKWMGHARIETTAIYADAVGPEEQKLAERMWS
jgi:integrase/recombinase XerD